MTARILKPTYESHMASPLLVSCYHAGACLKLVLKVPEVRKALDVKVAGPSQRVQHIEDEVSRSHVDVLLLMSSVFLIILFPCCRVCSWWVVA